MLNISELNSVPSMGALLGSRGSDELLASINTSLGASSYFGSSFDRYSDQHNFFMTRFVEPIRQANRTVSQISNFLLNRDVFKPIEDEEDLRTIPPCMMLPVLTHKPLSKLLTQGRIEGWGYTSEDVASVDKMYNRLLRTNGTVDLSTTRFDKDGAYWSVETYYTTDPKITFEDRISVEATERYIDKVLKDTLLDPTNLDELRG